MFVSTIAKVQARLNSMRSEEGATAVEYGIIVGVIAVAVGAGVALLGPSISAAFTAANGAF